MASDVLTEDQKVVVPIFKAFDRDLPEHLETPEGQVAEALDMLEDHITKLEGLAKQTGAVVAAKKATEYRSIFLELKKKALKKDDPKKLAQTTEEVLTCDQQVTAELEVPLREAGVAKALSALKGRAKGASASQIAAFEKEQRGIAKEKDPKKRCDRYFLLERAIIKADLLGREADEPGSTWQDHVELALQDARPPGLTERAGRELSRLKQQVVSKVTGSSTEVISDEEFLALKTAFVNSCDRRIEDMADAVPEASEKEFRAKADACVTAIAEELFALARKPADRQLLGKLLMQAQTTALQQLTALKRQYPANMTPQITVQDGKIVITKAAPPVESLVLQGGGGKGAGYPPVLEEMQKAGMLDGVNLVVGTSIGALNASCLACGGLADERQILDIKVLGQGFDPSNFKKQYPDVTFENPSPWIESPRKKLLKKVSNQLPSCAGEMAKLDQLTAASVAEQLKPYPENELAAKLSAKLATLDDGVLEKLGLAGATAEVIDREVKKLAKKVKNQDFGSGDRTSQMITFKDLAILHQLDPVNFKELTITGWEGTGADGHRVYFNAKDFPDMPVALAARISMGLPVFAPLYWKGRGPFFDGGLGSNAPVEATPGLDEFYHGKDPADAEEELKGDVPLEVQEAMAKTMLMTFDDEGKGEKNLYGEGRKTTAVSTGEKATLVKTDLQPKFADTLASDATKVYNTGVNTLEVYHGDLGTLSLGPLASAEAVDYAENMARLKGLEQLDQRLDQAVAVTCTSTDEALVGLSDADKRRLVAAGKPEGADSLVLELFQKCQQYLVLDDAFQSIRGGDATGFLDLLAASPLCASVGDAIARLRAAYNQHVKGQSDAKALDESLKTAAQAIGECPAFLRAMLKEAVLLPMQQRKREMATTTDEGAPSFLWQQEFSAQAFDNSLCVAAKNNVLLYLKEAQAAHEALKVYEKRNAEFAAKTKPKEVCEAARQALTALEAFLLQLRIMGDVPSYAAVPTLRDYIQWLQQKAGDQVDRLRSSARGKDAAYPAHPFVAWDRKDWERKKREAIDSGVLEDPGSTGLGAQMEEAVKASAAWNQAGPDAKVKAGKAAAKAWDKLIRLAKAVRGMTENKNFASYLEDCVTKATPERAKFAQL
jgi:predicted acylesterase/phospholipase RssA